MLTNQIDKIIINQIDELFDITINNFYDFLSKKDSFNMFTKDSNFVVYQTDILLLIKEFIQTIDNNKILNIVKKDSHIDLIMNIIKRYCALYIYLGIGYYYTSGRDLFITNIIECSKNQRDTTLKIDNFYNSENNAKIIGFFSDIQNIKGLIEFKTIDKIKIIIQNNPIKFDSIINIFNELGEDYIINNFLIKDNFHNILKTIIFRFIYLKEDKDTINQLLNELEKDEGEYTFIDIVISNSNKVVDFNFIQKFLSITQLNKGLAQEIYDYLIEDQENKDIILHENQDFINYLFSNKILIPITEDFLRYHKDTEKYENVEGKRDNTKIKYMVNKVNTVKNYYSSNVDNKIEAEKHLYKNLDTRMAILFNDNEEIKVIQKLLNVDSNNDLLIELENIRKYAYINFKNSNHDYIKLRTSNMIEAIRYVNLKKKKNEVIETRIGHNNIDLNVIGVGFNPSRLNINKTKKSLTPLECIMSKDLINVSDITKNENGYLSFIKVINKVVTKSFNNKIFYWLFNNKTDIPKLNKYIDYNKLDVDKNIKTMLSEFYSVWTNIVKNKFINYISSLKSISLESLYLLLNIYEKKYFNFNFSPEIKNDIIYKTITTKFNEITLSEDEIDNIIPGYQSSLIKLPVANLDKYKKNVIVLNEKEIHVETALIPQNAICIHYVKWIELGKISKTNDSLNQAVFEFVKKYVYENDRGDYLCKSCNELLSLHKYKIEGTYNKDLDQFMTTSMAIQQQLTDLPQYANLKRTVNNLGKLLEKISYSSNITYYLGNDSTTKLHRKTVVKDTIDLILLHTEYLRKTPKDRISKAAIKYNIKEDLTNLFFFELKDEIFLTSSTDTDKYKLLKYNNVLIYLLFIIITELNPGQILGFKNTKQYNFLIYSNIDKFIFKDLFLRTSEKDKIPILKFPLLCYVIYYFACLFSYNKFWLWNDTSVGKSSIINIQNNIIHTIVDLFNTIIEANLNTNKNFFYEIISTRFLNKLKSNYSDKQLLDRINIETNTNIKIDNKTKQIMLNTNKAGFIAINNDIEFTIDKNFNYCHNSTKKLNKKLVKFDDNIMNSLSNCDDGNLHKWILDGTNMVCSLCKKSYIDIIKLNNTETETNINYFNKLKIIYAKKLVNKYCLDGNLHQIDINTGICSLCNLNPSTFQYTDKDVNNLITILEKNEYDTILANYKIMEQHEIKIKETHKLYHVIKGKFNQRFKIDILEKYSNNNLENYVIDFVEKLINILGPKIKVKNDIYYLKETQYIIDHDFLGNSIERPFTILSNENIILIFKSHPYFKKDILYYKDNKKKIYIYYDIVTLQYLGYSEDNKTIKHTKNNVAIKVIHSVKNSLLFMGLDDLYTDIYNYDINLINVFDPKTTDIINNILRTRITNLKQIISRSQSIIYSIFYNNKINSYYNYKEKEIINEFTSKIKKFNIKNNDNSNAVFKHSKHLCNLLNFKKININIDNIEYINSHYIDNDILKQFLNTDAKLIYFIIMNFNRLLDYNKNPVIESEIAYLVVKIIHYTNELYFKDHNIEVRKFEYLITNNISFIQETNMMGDLYSDYSTLGQELDENTLDKIKNANIDAQEALDSLDIDDYEINDDIDESAEALDGYEE